MSQTGSLRIAVEIVEGVAVVQLLGVKEFYAWHADELGNGLFRLIDDAGHAKILVNLQGVEMMMSMPLYQLVRLNTRLAKAGGRLRVCSVAPRVKEAIHICGFDKILNIDPDEATALSKF